MWVTPLGRDHFSCRDARPIQSLIIINAEYKGALVMRGIVWNGVYDVRVETVPDPTIVAPTDAIVRVTKASICGTDLHVYNHGDAFGIAPGSRLGHEFVGVVEDVGHDVRHVKPGDKVISPFWISCGQCHFCRNELYSACTAGGAYGFGDQFWPADGPVQGGQSEYVRVPMANGTLERIPESLAAEDNDLRVLPLSDVLATGYHAVLGADLQPGDTVLVIGDGAVGLLAAHAARLFQPAAIVLAGHHDDRLEIGKALGATHTINSRQGDDVAAVVRELTDGLGADAVLDCVSTSQSMRMASEIVRPGKIVSWVGMGVFFSPPDIPWDLAFFRNLKFHGGASLPRKYFQHLWPHLETGRIDPSPVLTHDLPLTEGANGYEMMAQRKTGSIKVAVSP
jgi:threonine dehydrogenase-like Zn-dependent dehydrogenase